MARSLAAIENQGTMDLFQNDYSESETTVLFSRWASAVSENSMTRFWDF